EKTFGKALEIGEEKYGPDHPNVAACSNDLGEVFRARGKPGEAKEIYERALEIAEKSLGPEHPDSATYLNNQAEVLK
nr:tetratricopeptide repeat protein [Deltaproteobacteria bacterium]